MSGNVTQPNSCVFIYSISIKDCSHTSAVRFKLGQSRQLVTPLYDLLIWISFCHFGQSLGPRHVLRLAHDVIFACPHVDWKSICYLDILQG
jgi:hypothetical protein